MLFPKNNLMEYTGHRMLDAKVCRSFTAVYERSDQRIRWMQRYGRAVVPRGSPWAYIAR